MGNRVVRGALAAGAVLAVGLGVAGCSDPNVPSVVPTPEISWDPAAPEIPDDPNARAVFEYMVAAAVANNAHDFSIEQLSAVATEAQLIGLYENFLEDHVSSNKGWVQVMLGPSPFVFGEIEPAPDGGATVAVCFAQHRWYVTSHQPEPHLTTRTDGSEVTFVVELEDGVPKVSGTTGALRECDATGAAIGRFDEIPEIRENLSEDEVRPPIGYGDAQDR